jgi:antitoxin component of RelBE/YafQ-DinJ toxin-antitoxin module
LAQSDVLPFDFTALEKDRAFLRHPEDEETRQSDLNKKRQKDRLKSHAAWS